MVMAYDEGVWHPEVIFVYLWLLSALLSLVPLFLLAKSGQRLLAYYAGIALPLATLFALNVYLDYGTSGAYTGTGAIGPGAHFDIPKSLTSTLRQYLLGFAPTIIVVVLCHWEALRTKLQWLFWIVFTLAAIAQTLLALLLLIVFLEA